MNGSILLFGLSTVVGVLIIFGSAPQEIKAIAMIPQVILFVGAALLMLKEDSP